MGAGSDYIHAYPAVVPITESSIAVYSIKHNLIIIDCASGRTTQQLTNRIGAINSLLYLGNDLLVGLSQNFEVGLWNVKTGMLLDRVKHPCGNCTYISQGIIQSIGWNSFMTAQDNKCAIWKVMNGTKLYMQQLPLKNRCTQIAWMADRRITLLDTDQKLSILTPIFCLN